MIEKPLHIWMNIPSFHQNDLFNELCQRFDKFEVIYAHEQDLTRKEQGWDFDFIQHYDSKIISKNLNIRQLINYVFQNRTSTHIVNGIWAEKSFFFVILLLNLFRADFFIYSEAPVPTKKRSIFKKMMLNFLVKPISKLLIQRAKGFFAVSVFAEDYFKSLGIKPEKIYRFGYFRKVEKNDFIKTDSTINQLIFVGQLIERKGIFTLLEAIKNSIKITQNFQLNVIGTGDLTTSIKQYIQTHYLQNFITLQGAVDSQNVAQYIQKADLLILPSIFDGWGMVVNEALQNQVPVLISDQCGAKELIEHGKNGLIFEAQNVESLTDELLKFLQLSSGEKAKMKHNVSQKSKQIEIPTVVNYLMDCLTYIHHPNSPKPSAPWL